MYGVDVGMCVWGCVYGDVFVCDQANHVAT